MLPRTNPRGGATTNIFLIPTVWGFRGKKTPPMMYGPHQKSFVPHSEENNCGGHKPGCDRHCRHPLIFFHPHK